MGARSRLVEVDVDMVGDAALAAARERYGDTPITIRTASGKGKLWYRHNGEGRRIRIAGGLPIDILGAGYTIAPPSYRPDLGRSYGFLTGSLADLDGLPTIRAGALDMGRRMAAEAVQEGQRNDALFYHCLAQARFCDDADALIHVAQTWAAAMPAPLEPREAERTARSAWRYQVEGRNFHGLRCPQVTLKDKAIDDLSDEPTAFFLLELFERYHRNRGEFSISPAAMSAAGNPPWDKGRIARARDILIERGFIEVLVAPDRRKRRPGRYRLTRREIPHNHYTPSLLPWGTEGTPTRLAVDGHRGAVGAVLHG